MNKDQAFELARPIMLTAKSVHVLSNGTVYANANLEELTDYAEKEGLEIITLKGDEPKKPESKTSKKIK